MQKKIIFIRHAQSEENVKFENLTAGLQRIRRFQLPSIISLTDSLSLLQINLDSNLSMLGRQQIQECMTNLQESSFWDSFSPEKFLHSPLRRTKETLLGILPSNIAENADIQELSCLRELYPHEYLLSNGVYKRQREFHEYLDTVDAKSILVAGHGRYLRLLLNLPVEMRNVDIIEVMYNPSSNPSLLGTFDLSTLKQIYRCKLSTPHPNENHTSDTLNPPQSEQANEDPTCRICQMSKTETPEMRMIQPCKCSGSVSYVHIACLNQWRATSLTAQSTCSVCLYRYRSERTVLATFLMSESGAAVITVVIILTLTLFIGSLTSYITSTLGIDSNNRYLPINMFYRLTNFNPWWRDCYLSYDSMGNPSDRLILLQRLVKEYVSTLPLRKYLIFLYSFVFSRNEVAVGYLCNPMFVQIYTLESGIILITLCSFALYIFQEVWVGVFYGDQRRLVNIGLLIGYFVTSSGMREEAGRLAVGVGALVACRFIYLVCSEKGRLIGQYLGERILEPAR